MAAARGGRLGLVRLFIQHGADVNARSKRGRTALKATGSARKDKEQIIPELKRAGAKE